VIRNPTHYAVALRYEAQKDRAPRVVAKGTDLMALKIVEIAQQNDVYVTENRPLARGLYQAAQLDREIPEQYYLAVANVLAFVYNLKKKGRGA
jgi:flagellar biosynthetic protein FlhB